MAMQVCKFKEGQIVKHRLTGSKYLVIRAIMGYDEYSRFTPIYSLRCQSDMLFSRALSTMHGIYEFELEEIDA